MHGHSNIKFTKINVCVSPHIAPSLTLKMELAASARHVFTHLPNYTASHPVRPYTCIYHCDILEFITVYKLALYLMSASKPPNCVSSECCVVSTFRGLNNVRVLLCQRFSVWEQTLLCLNGQASPACPSHKHSIKMKISMQHWCNNTDRGKEMYWHKPLFQCPSLPQKISHGLHQFRTRVSAI